MRGKNAIYCLLFVGLLLSAGCKEETEYVYPPVLTEILCLESDSEGNAKAIHTDYRRSFLIANANLSPGSLTADSIYRVICTFDTLSVNPDEVGRSALVYTLKQVGSWNPIPEADFTEIKQDPVDIESIWISGDYLNFSALVMLQQQFSHVYRFVEKSEGSALRVRPEVHLSFYHDRGDDVEGYTERVYFSIPLGGYIEKYGRDMAIRFTINTYKEGMKEYRLGL